MGLPRKQSIGVPFHQQRNGWIDGQTTQISICPTCGAEYAMIRKDWESFTLSPEAHAHYRSHTSTLEALREAARQMVAVETETDPIPAAILAMCERRVGKPITKRDTDALMAAYPGLDAKISKEYGITIRWCAYVNRWDKEADRHYDDSNAVALVKAGVPRDWNNHGELRVGQRYGAGFGAGARTWPTAAELKEWNPRYFAGRDERNAERAAASTFLDGSAANDKVLATLASLIDQVNLMSEEINGQSETLPDVVIRVMRSLLKPAIEKLGGK